MPLWYTYDMPQYKSMRDRLMEWHRVTESGCWEWTGYMNPATGYGQTSIPIKRKTITAHRAAYEEFIGPIPEGMVIDHLCRNRKCINPTHLETVSGAINSRRGDWWKGLQISAQQKRAQKHCKRGHEFTTENTYWGKSSNTRACRTCHREREAARKRKVLEMSL